MFAIPITSDFSAPSPGGRATDPPHTTALATVNRPLPDPDVSMDDPTPTWLRTKPPAGVDICPAPLDDEREEEGSDDERQAFSGARAKSNALLRKEVGKRFVEARMLCGWEQGEAARRLSYENSTQLSLIEKGVRMPPPTVLIRASATYGVSLDFLLAQSAEPERDARTLRTAATLRRVEALLRGHISAIAELLVEDAARAPGEDALRIVAFVTKAQALVNAVATFAKRNPSFEDMRASATLVRAAEDLRETVEQLQALLLRGDRVREAAIRLAQQRIAANAAHHQSTGATA